MEICMYKKVYEVAFLNGNSIGIGIDTGTKCFFQGLI